MRTASLQESFSNPQPLLGLQLGLPLPMTSVHTLPHSLASTVHLSRLAFCPAT